MIGLIIARALSDKGYTVCVMIKKAGHLGFEPLFNDLRFLRYLCTDLGIEVGVPCSTDDVTSQVLEHAPNKELIQYLGENYRIEDYGYDGECNHFIVNESCTKRINTQDKVIKATLGNTEAWYNKFLPRSMKLNHLIGKQMIVFHWFEFIKGWGTNNLKGHLEFETLRPNVSPFFAADTLHYKLNSEQKANELLYHEVSQLIDAIKNLPKKKGR